MTENCIPVGGPVRKTVFDPNSKIFAVEYISDDNMLPQYAVIPTRTFGEARNIQLDAPDSLVTLVGIAGNNMIFTRFDDPEDPQETTIFSYDFIREEIAWERQGYTLIGIEKSVRIRSGTQLLNLRAEDGLEISPQEPSISDLRVPDRYHEGTTYFETVASFLGSRLKVNPVRVIDYLETKQSLFISYYLYRNDQLDLYLTLFDRQGNPFYEVILERNLQAPGTEAYSLLDNKLYYVREKSNFCRIIL